MNKPTIIGCSSAKPNRPTKNFQRAEKKPPTDIVSAKSNMVCSF